MIYGWAMRRCHIEIASYPPIHHCWGAYGVSSGETTFLWGQRPYQTLGRGKGSSKNESEVDRRTGRVEAKVNASGQDPLQLDHPDLS